MADIKITERPLSENAKTVLAYLKANDNGEVGYFGKLAYDVAEECDLRTPAYIMEIDLEILSKWYGKKAVFTVPPINEQHRIVSAIETAFAQLETITESLN